MAKVIRAENAVPCEMKQLFKTTEGYFNPDAYNFLFVSNVDNAK